MGTTIGDIRGNTRSLDYSSCIDSPGLTLSPNPRSSGLCLATLAALASLVGQDHLRPRALRKGVSCPDPQKDLKIRSPRSIGGIIYELYRGYDGSI